VLGPAVSLPSLQLVYDGKTVDLTGPTGSSRLVFPCDDCAANGIDAEVKPAVLREFVLAARDGGTALGVSFVISSADRTALLDFVDQLRLGIEPGDECASPDRAGAAVCFMSHPAYCEDAQYANSGACFLARARYCAGDRNANDGACFASHPSYCALERYADTGACFLGGAAHCDSERTKSSAACFASKPACCSSSNCAEAPACSGARPAYCAIPPYASSRACSGHGKPDRPQIIDAARQLGSPIDVARLLHRLMN